MLNFSGERRKALALKPDIITFTLFKADEQGIINYLLTEREVCTEKYQTKVFVQTEPVGRGLYKRPRSDIF